MNWSTPIVDTPVISNCGKVILKAQLRHLSVAFGVEVAGLSEISGGQIFSLFGLQTFKDKTIYPDRLFHRMPGTLHTRLVALLCCICKHVFLSLKTLARTINKKIRKEMRKSSGEVRMWEEIL
jgi:hypothetical protein